MKKQPKRERRGGSAGAALKASCGGPAGSPGTAKKGVKGKATRAKTQKSRAAWGDPSGVGMQLQGQALGGSLPIGLKLKKTPSQVDMLQQELSELSEGTCVSWGRMHHQQQQQQQTTTAVSMPAPGPLSSKASPGGGATTRGLVGPSSSVHSHPQQPPRVGVPAHHPGFHPHLYLQRHGPRGPFGGMQGSIDRLRPRMGAAMAAMGARARERGGAAMGMGMGRPGLEPRIKSESKEASTGSAPSSGVGPSSASPYPWGSSGEGGSSYPGGHGAILGKGHPHHHQGPPVGFLGLPHGKSASAAMDTSDLSALSAGALGSHPSSSHVSLLKTKQSSSSAMTHQSSASATHQRPRIKASNFPASTLQIGTWKKVASHEGELIAKCYYAKKKLVWEVLENATKKRIEISWDDISKMSVETPPHRSAFLEIELRHPPTFAQESEPQPRRHTMWNKCDDFTSGCQASLCKPHRLFFAPGVLNKHIERLRAAGFKALG